MKKKQLIINSFLDLIYEEKNADNISLKSIATKAEIGKSTIYEYFKNKEDLIKETSLYVIDIAFEKIINVDTDNHHFEKAFKKQIKSILTGSKHTKIVFEMLMMNKFNSLSIENMYQIKKKVNQYREEINLKITKMMQKGVEEYKLDLEFIKDKKLIISGLINGTIFQAIHSKDEIDIDKTIDDLFEVFLKITK